MLRKALLATGLAVVIVAGAAGYLWRKGTALPDWYEAERDDIAKLESLEGGDERFDPSAPLEWSVIPNANRSSDAESPPSTAPPRRRELRNFHLRSGASSQAARKAFRASRATFEDGELEAGVVVNVGKAERGELTRKERQFFDRITKAFPPLAKRDVYVALEDEPIAGPDGILQLGPNPKVRVGDLTYSLTKLAKKLGVNPSALRRDINNEMRRLKVKDPADLPALVP